MGKIKRIKSETLRIEALQAQYPHCSKYVIDALFQGIRSNLAEDQLCLYTAFDFRYASQVRAIEWGLRDGLSVEQIRLYADTKYNGQQMEQIRLGMVHNLTNEQLSLYLDPAFSWDQMKRIRCDLENGFSVDEVSGYAMPELTVGQMSEANRQLIRSKHPQTVDPDEFLSNLKIHFNQAQVKQIHLGALHGLTREQLLLYATQQWSAPQMRQLRLGMENGLTHKEMRIILNPAFSAWRMELVREALEKRLPKQRLDLFTAPEWDDLQANSIQKAVLAGLSDDQIAIYANSFFTGYQMGVLYYGLLNGYKMEQMAFLTKNPLEYDDLTGIMDGYLIGFSHQQRRLVFEIWPPACNWLIPPKKDILKQDIR